MGITTTGYETTPESTIKSEVEQVFKDALGNDLSLDAETPQGNLIAALTSMLHQIDAHRQRDFYARDVYHAQGIQLDIIGREFGLPRKQSVPTQILVQLNGAINYSIVAGTKANIVTDSSQVFEFPTAVQIMSSSQQVTLQAANGAVYENLVVGQKLQTQEYMPQIYDMTVVSIVYGQPAESDYRYRIRLVEAAGSNVDEAKHLEQSLEVINNVLSAYVDPNNTLETSPTGVPPHAVEIVVLGGNESDIATVLMQYLFATPTYKDPTLGEEIKGLDFHGNTQTFYITRPKQIDVSVSVKYTNKSGMTLSPEQIAQLTTAVQELINSTYMNGTLYASDVCNLLTSGYTQTYAVDELSITVNGVAMGASYQCTSRQYLYASNVTFTENN